jgi:sigma-54 specific flagellar transcriptional regulator A
MENFQQIVGLSQSIKDLQRMTTLFAASSATVLIQGESGTGKELVAQALHRSSLRRGNAFVPLNCAAIPKDLLESELFGHRKGAFSGAIADHMGRFELAEGGTIFLDEVGDMSLDLQSKMLRVLQERVIDPVGSTRQISIDVRVIAATNRDLEAECAAGRFREDLYYRLNVLPITVPPLRERPEDITALAVHFASRHCAPGMPPVGFEQEFLEILKSYSWPGNVREMSNLIHRLSVLYPGQNLRWRKIPMKMFPRTLRDLMPADDENYSTPDFVSDQVVAIRSQAVDPAGRHLEGGCPPEADYSIDNPLEDIIMIANGKRNFPDAGVSLKEHLADLEKKIISHALNHAGGNITRTAQLLKLQRTTLIQKMNKFKEDVDDESDALRGVSSLESDALRGVSSLGNR